VDELGLLVPAELARVDTEAQGVEAKVAGEGAVQVRGQLRAGVPRRAVGLRRLLLLPVADPLLGVAGVGFDLFLVWGLLGFSRLLFVWAFWLVFGWWWLRGILSGGRGRKRGRGW
jgi:hypothetical protein